MRMLSELWEKHKGLFWYGFFGICTTVINIIAYDICSSKFKFETVVSTVIAWIIAVLFVFFTNRKYVFKSSSVTYEEQITEFVRFICSRLSTGILDVAGMYLFVDVLHFNEMIIKMIMNVLVIILNYVASNRIVFK